MTNHNLALIYQWFLTRMMTKQHAKETAQSLSYLSRFNLFTSPICFNDSTYWSWHGLHRFGQNLLIHVIAA